MKFFWPILLIYLVLGNAKTHEKTLNKLAKVVKFLKVFDDINERKRKLQQSTDDTTGDTTDGAVTGNNTVLPINKDYATEKMNRTTGNENAPFHIKDFKNFKQNAIDPFFTFDMVFAFFQRTIVSLITMRLRIVYAPRSLRNLEDEAQAVGCNCSISRSFDSKVGEQGNKEDIDYNCRGEKESGRNVSTVNLDTTEPICFEEECVNFTDVNFSDEADKKAGNITRADEVEQTGAVYRKSSSGLSGGAIAGIVIACVVVLIAAAVAAIMLRKPTPPIDNTTVVDLKQENI